MIEARKEYLGKLADEVQIKKARLKVLNALIEKFDEKLLEVKNLLKTQKPEVESVIQPKLKRSAKNLKPAKSSITKSFSEIIVNSKVSPPKPGPDIYLFGHSSDNLTQDLARPVSEKEKFLKKTKAYLAWSDQFNLPERTRCILVTTSLTGCDVKSEETLTYFSKYGKIVDSFTPNLMPGRPKLFFLKFQDYNSSAAARADSPHYIGNKYVFAYKAKDK